MKSNKKYFPLAIALYLTYFVHGIGASILGQYKQEFAQQWGAETLSDGSFDVSTVLVVIAALGLGRLISLPFAGPISDKYGRKVSSLIGLASYVLFFGGVIFSPNMQVAYAFALFGGIANSFLDTGVIPSVLEIFPENGAVANMVTKFAISIAQFFLPFMIGYVATANLSFKTLFIISGAVLLVDAIVIAFMKFPPRETKEDSTEKKESVKIKLTPRAWAVIALGFTLTSTFQLWLNCNQELGRLYGVVDPSKIQSYYSSGAMIAVIFTAFLVQRYVKPIRILVIYPAIAAVMLAVIYFVEIPAVVLIGGFVLGFAAAGGVLQLAVSTANEMYPHAKGKITSIIMIASSLANYTILNVAGALTKSGGVDGPKYVLLLNLGITVVGILFAVYINVTANKDNGNA
ncbi:MAG TPA: MFS transporter [Firmicutes bacterium]|nr:MFS transporter [Bacillota bacterium]